MFYEKAVRFGKVEYSFGIHYILGKEKIISLISLKLMLGQKNHEQKTKVRFEEPGNFLRNQ